MIRRFFMWLVVGPPEFEAATVGLEARIDSIGLEMAALRHLADSLEKERDAARAELERVKNDHLQLGQYVVGARQEAAAAYQHLGRLLSWVHPPVPTQTKDGTS